MGTPHVHCMSKLPTAHEPADRAAGRLGDGQRPGGRDDGADQVGAAQLNGVRPPGQSRHRSELRVTTLGPRGSSQ